MIKRFQGQPGRSALLEALKIQKIIRGDQNIADDLLEMIELIEFKEGDCVIEQGSLDNSLYFILIGEVQVFVNERPIAIRRAGSQLGEMTLIDPRFPRSASIIAKTDTVLAKATEDQFSLVAEKYPILWRLMAIEVSDWLREMSKLVDRRNVRPVIFLGSSSESLHIANQIEAGICGDDVSINLWTSDVFLPSHFPIDDLSDQVRKSDFAVLIISSDDLVMSRNESYQAPRDNIIFELGLFMGALSRKRTFLMYPDMDNVKLPSDLEGITTIRYVIDSDGNQLDNLKDVCAQIRTSVMRLGPK
jgi:predicted nucleotide-binding protein